jgi:hypothetical protein
MSYPPQPDPVRVTGMKRTERATVRQGDDVWAIDATDPRGVIEVRVRQVTDSAWTTDPTTPLVDPT